MADQSDIEKDLAAYKMVNVELHLHIAHLKKALRKIQGSDNLKDCHRIAESILNERKDNATHEQASAG